jgi:putative ABC transport system substrate-binding protein
LERLIWSLLHQRGARALASFVDKVVEGAKAGDIPVEQATVVNLKTVQALGIGRPPTLLAAAEAIE